MVNSVGVSSLPGLPSETATAGAGQSRAIVVVVVVVGVCDRMQPVAPIAKIIETASNRSRHRRLVLGAAGEADVGSLGPDTAFAVHPSRDGHAAPPPPVLFPSG